MPNRDKYHAAVVRALENDGWDIAREQALLKVDDRYLWVDLEAVKGEQTILVEVKGFEELASAVRYLYQSFGQYMLYDAILEYLQQTKRLYLAVPSQALNGILSDTLGQIMRRKAEVNLIIFDPEQEEIRQWINFEKS